MRPYRLRTAWRRITPLKTYPRLLAPALDVFQHHTVTALPVVYFAALKALIAADQAATADRRKSGRKRASKDLRRRVKAALGRVLDFERDHMRVVESIAVNRGFLGISYSIAAFPSGFVWKARGWRKQGAHTLGRNDDAVAIVAVGNYETSKPSAALEEGIARTLAKGHKRRRLRKGFGYKPHSDAPGAATACPGKFLRDRMPSIRRRSERLAV